MRKQGILSIAACSILLLFVGSNVMSSVVGTVIINLPPGTPGVPSGPAALIVGENGRYSTSTTDLDGDRVSYRFDWDAAGSHDYSGWTPLVNSGMPGNATHAWHSPGTYVVRAQARDEHWAFSGWSGDLVVVIVVNNPPNIPTAPSGPTELVVGEIASYSTNAVDPDGDQVAYWFDWNATGAHDYSGWTPLVNSGDPGSLTHAWHSPGTYAVRAQARDEHWSYSEWSRELAVVVYADDPPVVHDDYITVSEDSQNNQIDVLANDSDIQGFPLTVISVEQPSHGASSTDGAYCYYTPTALYEGSDSFPYTISNGHGGTATATVFLTISYVNHAPVAQDDFVVLDVTSHNQVDVLVNDSDIDGDALTVISVTQPAHGHSFTNGVSCFCAPVCNSYDSYSGPDSFTYTISDGNGGYATATVFVTVVDLHPPNTPCAPSGPTHLVLGQNGMYFANTTDLDGGQVMYLFDWDAAGAHSYSDTPWFNSGSYYGRARHAWTVPGTYVVKVRARDQHCLWSGWSSGFTVVVIDNHPPNTPNTPKGPIRFLVGETVGYFTSTTDPDGDRVAYRFDWNAAGAHDYSSWTGLMNSGTYYGKMPHTWATPGTYVVKVQARDEHGALSGWSDGLTVLVRSPPSGT